MEDEIQQLFNEPLHLPMNAISYYVSQKLASIYSQKALLEVKNDYAFDVEAFADNIAAP